MSYSSMALVDKIRVRKQYGSRIAGPYCNCRTADHDGNPDFTALIN